MGNIVTWNEIKQPAMDEELEKVTSGTLIWVVTAEKTTNSGASADRLNAKSGRSDYFPTPDGLYCLKTALWIVETVKEESRRYDCKRMTRHGNRDDARLTPSQQVQTMRVLYSDGTNNSNDHGLPVIKVSNYINEKAGGHISLISMNDSKTIRATQGMVLYGVLEPPSILNFLRKSLQVKSDKIMTIISSFQGKNIASQIEEFVAHTAIQGSSNSGIDDELSSSCGG